VTLRYGVRVQYIGRTVTAGEADVTRQARVGSDAGRHYEYLDIGPLG
jgi:hypothetical protein